MGDNDTSMASSLPNLAAFYTDFVFTPTVCKLCVLPHTYSCCFLTCAHRHPCVLSLAWDGKAGCCNEEAQELRRYKFSFSSVIFWASRQLCSCRHPGTQILSAVWLR